MSEEHTSSQESQNYDQTDEAKTENAAAEVEESATLPVEDLDPLADLKKKFGILESENAALRQEVSDLKDQYLRTRADFENTKKRLQRDKDEAIQFANKQLLIDMVGIMDDFERAIRSGEESKDFDKFHDGISLIEKQFVSTLERKWGITRFDGANEEFDPQRHEAVAAEPRGDLPPSSIIEVYQKGYLLHDKVLRTAKVKVSLPA